MSKTKTPPARTRTSARISHHRALQISSRNTRWFYQMARRRDPKITPHTVIRTLRAAGVKFILMGAYGISGWLKEPRATQDVDVLVRKSHHKKAVAAIRVRFPHLILEDLPFVTRFRETDDGPVLLDLMKATHDLYGVAFDHAVPAGDTHLVPNLEFSLAAKFAAMISPHREDSRRMRDASDFIEIVQKQLDKLNREVLRGLGELVYSGGGDRLLAFVEDVIAGRKLLV
jgi:hypothetical protein